MKRISKAAMRRRMAKVRAGRKSKGKRNPYTAKSKRTYRPFPGASKPKAKRKNRRYASRQAFAKGSFRAVRSGKGRVIVGCPKGKWSAKRKKGHQCKVGMRPYRVKKNPQSATRYFAIRRGGQTVVFKCSAKPTKVGAFSAKSLKAWQARNSVRAR